MKKSLTVLIAAFLVLGALGAPAATAKKKKKKKAVPVTKTITFEQEGTIAVPSATSTAGSGITEAEFAIANSCGSMPSSQGLDGYVVEIPQEYQSGTGTLQVSGSDATGAYDLDVFFYDAGCNLMEPYMQNDVNESGPILPGAKWAVVNLFVGANASFKLTGTTTVRVAP